MPRITLYDGQKISTLPMEDGDRRGDYARVRMEIRTNSGKTIPIYYTLFLRDDQWKVINVACVNGWTWRIPSRASLPKACSSTTISTR